MSSSYVDTDTLKAILELATSDTSLDDILDAKIAAASDGIDNALGRSFTLSEADESRLFTATRPDMVAIDDLATFTSLTVDQDGDGVYEETWTRDTDFTLLPLNVTPAGRPWESIEVRRATGRYTLPFYTGAVKVTGKFGWTQTPAPIVEAATLIAQQLVGRKDAPFGVLQFTAGDAVTAAHIARTDPHINMLLTPYQRKAHSGSLQLG